MSSTRITSWGVVTAIAAAALTLLASPTARAVDSTDPYVLTADNSGLAQTEIVSTGGPGDATAAWIDGDTGAYRVRSATAVDGVWGSPTWVSAAGKATDWLALETNDAGSYAAVWLEKEGDSWKAIVARGSGGGWTSPITLASTGVTAAVPALAVGGDGTVHVSFAVTVAGKSQLKVVTWKPGLFPTTTTLVSELATPPALDANDAGQAVLSFGLDEVSNSVYATEYSPGTESWGEPEQVSFLGAHAIQSTVAIDGSGRSTVAFDTKVGDHFRIQVATEVPAGTGWAPPVSVSAADKSANFPSLAVDASGRSLLGWQTITDADVYGGAYSSRPATGGTWSPPTPLSTPEQPDHYIRPRVRVGATGAQVIDFVTNDRRTTLVRSNPALSFKTLDLGTGYGVQQWYYDVHVDDAGGVALIEQYEPPVGYREIRTRFIDIAGPTTTLAAIPATSTTTGLSLAWTTSDDLSAIAGTTVVAFSAAWDETDFGFPAVVVDGATVSPAAFEAEPGTSYCFVAQSEDLADNTGPSSEQRCTAVPLDDRKLAGKGWIRPAEKGSYLGTLTTTTTKGARLSVAGVHARRIALVVKRLPKGGRVQVRLGSEVLRTIGLKGTGNRRVVKVATFDEVRTGKVTVKVVSRTGRKVAIDGLVVAK